MIIIGISVLRVPEHITTPPGFQIEAQKRKKLEESSTKESKEEA